MNSSYQTGHAYVCRASKDVIPSLHGKSYIGIFNYDHFCMVGMLFAGMKNVKFGPDCFDRITPIDQTDIYGIVREFDARELEQFHKQYEFPDDIDDGCVAIADRLTDETSYITPENE